MEGCPDHGMGGLGQMAHAVLRDSRRNERSGEARLFLGLNTQPDRPFPLVGYIGFPTAPGAWRACGGDAAVFLAAAVRSLQAQPVPEGAAFGPEYRHLQRMLRQDAIALSLSAYLVLPQNDPGGKALLDNLVEGYLLPEDLELSPAARVTDLVFAAERSGGRLIVLAPADAPDEEALPLDPADTTGQATLVLDLLAELLDAQYTWNQKVFG